MSHQVAGSEPKSLGLVLGSSLPPEELVPVAVQADELGLDELWFSEDCFFTGGISGATAALAATSRIQVGLGIVSAMLRHPALLAMEVATMARAFPDRLAVGIGLGVPAWLRQVGRSPGSALGAMTECVTAVRQLVAGERLCVAGEEFLFDDVALAHPVTSPPPIYMGVSGPRMLQLSGELADGSILSVGGGVNYLTWARQQIDAGRSRAGRTGPHRVTAFALYAVDRDRQRARDEVRGPLAFYTAAGGANAMTDVEGTSDVLRGMLDRGGAEIVAREMPESWLEDLSVSGTPEDCARGIRSLYEAGADSVALFPVSVGRTQEMAQLTAAEVIPLLRQDGCR
ncbi:MAG TPA: LLM class flavin-dependent oxidoreductase [Streptosporangiaceae bacterium]|nr:LLM class flavin-dependent oxidoreductase [Streptosporangiaceae bacterium]